MTLENALAQTDSKIDDKLANAAKKRLMKTKIASKLTDFPPKTRYMNKLTEPSNRTLILHAAIKTRDN